MEADFVMAATGASRAVADQYLPHLVLVCQRYDINTRQRQAAFLSQIGHESAGMSRLSESLNYSVDALLRMFGRHRISEDDARRYGRTTKQPADQQALANALYGGDWGWKNLGNTEPGDGWRYRGRGLKQLTGRSNYARCAAAIGLDLVGNPDLLLEPGPAAMSAGWFWGANGCNALADSGDVAALTKRINGGDFGLKERQALFSAALATLA